MRSRGIIIGNWKMELSHKAELEVATSLKKLLPEVATADIDIVICPSYPSLPVLSADLKKNGKLKLGAQNVHWEEKGAHTGSVSLSQISTFITHCIVGHSEQRQLTHVTDKEVSLTAALLLKHGIIPIVCLGETAEERSNDLTDTRIAQQINTLLENITRASLPNLVIAYEPIWAISANNPTELPDPSEVSSTMLLMRKLTAAKYNKEHADRMKIIYGGSVNPDNIESFIKEPGVEGALIGSASIHPRKFIDIIKSAHVILQPT